MAANNNYSWEAWEHVTPKIDFKDIKVGDILHIPAAHAYKRQDIIVTNVSKECISYDTIGGKYPEHSAIYPSSILAKLVTKKKI